MENNSENKQLFEYYIEKIHPILISVKDIVHIHSADDIHKLRVDLKKIKALFYLFEIAEPKKFNADKHYAIFEHIFDQAGKIREAQMNQFCLDKYKLADSTVLPFKKFLNRKEKKSKRKFSNLIVEFNNKKINDVDHEVKKLCHNISNDKILKHSSVFISKKIKKIKNIPEVPDNKTLHNVRKNLKSISAISSLLYSLDPSKKLAASQIRIKKAETLIGDWHDQIVFEQSLNEFFKRKKNESDEALLPLQKLLKNMEIKNQKVAKSIAKKIQTALPELK